MPLALHEYAGDLAISFNGAEDVVLGHMAKTIGGASRYRSPAPESYQFLETVHTRDDLPHRHLQ